MLQPCFTPVLILNLAIHYCAFKVIVEYCYHVYYLWWYAVPSHNQPQIIPVYKIKCFFEKVNIQWWLPPYWLFDDISLHENLLSSSSTWSITCLFFSKLRLYFGSYPVNHCSPHDVTHNWQQGNSTPVLKFFRFHFFGRLTISPFLHFLGVFSSLHTTSMISLTLVVA